MERISTIFIFLILFNMNYNYIHYFNLTWSRSRSRNYSIPAPFRPKVPAPCGSSSTTLPTANWKWDMIFFSQKSPVCQISIADPDLLAGSRIFTTRSEYGSRSISGNYSYQSPFLVFTKICSYKQCFGSAFV